MWFPSEHFVTLITWERLLTIVCPEIMRQASFLPEYFVALITLIGTPSTVRSDIVKQTRLHWESYVTLITLERFQVQLIFKCFVTLVILVPFLPGVRSEVLSKVCLLCKCLTTCVTQNNS